MSDSPDRLTWLLEELASGDADIEVLWELPAAVHAAIYPLCLSLVDGPDAAYDAEQETWRRLLAHITQAPGDPEIGNGTGYVQQIARDVCSDPRPAEGMHHDLAGLSEEDQAVLGLRHAGRSYQQLARGLGRGLTGADVQTQHERALHLLRGRVHVEMWLREGWAAPACPEMARLQAETRALVQAGQPVTTTLYRAIGLHLDPRSFCQLCHPERERSELAYWWLVATLPPVLAGRAAAVMTKRTRRRLVRNIAVAAAVVILAAALVVLITPSSDPVAKPNLPNPCQLLTQDEVASSMGRPVRPCAFSGSIRVPLTPTGSTRKSAQATYQSEQTVGDAVTIVLGSLGTDVHTEFTEMCKALQERSQQTDPSSSTGSVPGVGEENCYIKFKIADIQRDVAVVGFAARRGAVVVYVAVAWTERHELPTDLVKLALTRVP